MKSVTNIISSLQGSSNFSKLDNLRYFNNIKESIPKKLSENIEFMYIKNRTLFFVFNHPAMKQEFEYKKVAIKKVIDILQSSGKIMLDIDDIKSFVTNRVKEIDSIRTEYRFDEISKGEFENRIKDENIAKILEEIRESINARR
jgi:cell division GTPase FtsZ